MQKSGKRVESMAGLSARATMKSWVCAALSVGIGAGVVTATHEADAATPRVEARQDGGGGLSRPSSRTAAQRDAWVEVLESFDLPDDPDWSAAARAASDQVRLVTRLRSGGGSDPVRLSLDSLRVVSRDEASRIERQLADFNERIERAKSTKFGSKKTEEEGWKRIVDSVEKIADSLRAASDRTAPLTVVRLWDGIERKEVVVTLGRGQKAVANRLVPGKPMLASIGTSTVGDDMQAERETVTALQSARSTPSEFLRATDGAGVLAERGFGEVDSRAQREAVIIRAVKDPAPGSGALTLELAAPPTELGINTAYPWYAEFKLFELGKDGSRAREVRFDGTNAIVAVETQGAKQIRQSFSRPGFPARGRVEVKSPVPWGYEAVVVKWFGVAAKDRLVAGSGAKPAANRPLRESDAAAPAEPAEPLEETAPPALPEEPQTPDIPGIRL
jgi:hypothetical protein